MEEEKGEDQGRSKVLEVGTMKFSFTASKTKFSASRPPLFPKGKQRGDGGGNKDVEFVTAFEEQGIVAKDPRGLRGGRVIPKLENSWRPEKRMKNIMMDTDIINGSQERFEKETVITDSNANVHYGLTVVKKVEAAGEEVVTTSMMVDKVEERNGNANLTLSQLEDQRLREDLISLPDVADLDAYEEMPVEEFGEAILRGMGWEKGKPIGRNCKVAVVPVEYVRRSGRTGLGAEPVPKDYNNSKQIKPGESRVVAPDLVASVGTDGRVRNVVTVDEKLVERTRKGVVKGKVMSIISGRHVGLRAEVLDAEISDRVSLKLVKSGEKVFVSAKDLADIGSVEEEKVLKQIRQLRIGNGEASRREDIEENDHHGLHMEETSSDRKEEKLRGRKEDREGPSKDTRRDERDDYRREEDRSRTSRDSRMDQRERPSRDERRERKRDERTSDDMEVDDEERSRRSDQRLTTSREQKERGHGRRESRRDGRREEERAQRAQERYHQDRDERGAGRDRKCFSNDGRLSDDRQVRDRGTWAVGNIDRDSRERLSSEGHYKDSWLTSHIRVRVISKTLKGGKLYLKKARIVDVVTPKECDILLDESGEILEHVKQDYLETALPRRGGRVMVVGGAHRGHLGKLIERDSEGEVGVVQMEETFEITTLSLDLLAEFVGDASERDV